MTRLLAVAALAALITGCAMPYGPHAQGGMRGMHGMQGMQGMHGQDGTHGQGGIQGHHDMHAKNGKAAGGCMHMQRQAGAKAAADQPQAGMHERMQEHMQAKAQGMGKMCEAHSGPAGDGDGPQHRHQQAR
jgi:hypothetical protein